MTEQTEATQRVGALLEAWRVEQGPGAVERDRMWASIAARAELGDPLAELPAPAAIGAAARAWPLRLRIGAIAIAAAAVLAVAIAPRPRELPRTLAPALQQAIRVVLPTLERRAEPARSVVVAELPPQAAAPVVVPEPVVVTHPRARVRRAPQPPAPPSIDPAEVALLERAQRRLATDPIAALALFEQHARDYPESALAGERELGRADARCRSGDVAGARALVDRFTRARSGSPLLARMRSICAEP
jgi:hypothetical protein